MVGNAFQSPQFPFERLFVQYAQSDLIILRIRALERHEIDFLISRFADKNPVAAPSSFQIDDIFKNVSVILFFIA